MALLRAVVKKASCRMKLSVTVCRKDAAVELQESIHSVSPGGLPGMRLRCGVRLR
jgi:hypothetical protein